MWLFRVDRIKLFFHLCHRFSINHFNRLLAYCSIYVLTIYLMLYVNWIGTTIGRRNKNKFLSAYIHIKIGIIYKKLISIICVLLFILSLLRSIWAYAIQIWNCVKPSQIRKRKPSNPSLNKLSHNVFPILHFKITFK